MADLGPSRRLMRNFFFRDRVPVRLPTAPLIRDHHPHICLLLPSSTPRRSPPSPRMRRSRPSRSSSHLPITTSSAPPRSSSLWIDEATAGTSQSWACCSGAGTACALVLLVVAACAAMYVGMACTAQDRVHDAMEQQLREIKAMSEADAEEQRKQEVREEGGAWERWKPGFAVLIMRLYRMMMAMSVD